MSSTLLPPPKPLDNTGDVYHNWNIWKSEFELFAIATKLKLQPQDVQAATFLMTIGEEARRVFRTFKFEDEEQKNDLKALTQKFEDLNEFRFGSRNRREGEPFNDWLTEIRILAALCEFGELEDRLLRSRIILGIRDKELQQRLISENPSYAKTVEICRAKEQSKEQVAEIRGSTSFEPERSIDVVEEKNAPCRKCGLHHHKAAKCPAIGKYCKKCNGRNHFASVCRTRSLKTRPEGRHIRQVEMAEDEEYVKCGRCHDQVQNRHRSELLRHATNCL